MNEISILQLGCGSAKPTPRHYPSATLLDARGNLHLIDCGEGAQRQMMIYGCKFHRLCNIFITHLHGDHILGLPGLLSTLSLMGKQGVLRIHTFKAGIEWIRGQVRFFGSDLGYEIEYNEIDPSAPQQIYSDRQLSVRTVPLNHRVDCVGFIFEEHARPRHIDKPACDWHGVPLRYMKELQAGADFTKPDGTVIPNHALTKPPTPSVSYAHISDTAYTPELAPLIGPVNLLFHETTYLSEHAALASERGHSTAAQAAQMAELCGAGRLLTGHYSSRYKDEKEFLRDATAIHSDTILGHEGLRIAVD